MFVPTKDLSFRSLLDLEKTQLHLVFHSAKYSLLLRPYEVTIIILIIIKVLCTKHYVLKIW